MRLIVLVSVNMDPHSSADNKYLSKSNKDVIEWYTSILNNRNTSRDNIKHESIKYFGSHLSKVNK